MFGAKPKPSRAREFTTHINDGTEIEGKIAFSGAVLLNGRIVGEVDSSDTFVVGDKGVVNGTIRAGLVEVYGEVRGNITATERIQLHANCRVYGDIEAPAVIIDEGALLEGQCRMTKPAPAFIASIDSGVVPLKRQELPG